MVVNLHFRVVFADAVVSQELPTPRALVGRLDPAGLLGDIDGIGLPDCLPRQPWLRQAVHPAAQCQAFWLACQHPLNTDDYLESLGQDVVRGHAPPNSSQVDEDGRIVHPAHPYADTHS